MEDAPIPIAELDQGPSKFEEFLDKNQKKLIILTMLIFLGVIAYVFTTGLEKKKATEAGAALMEASDEESYRKVISDYSVNSTAGSAAIAIAQLRTTDDDRIEALEHFIKNYPNHPGIPTKLLELALIQMNTGKNGDAETTLNQLISNDKSAFLAPRARIALADIAAAENKLDEAEQIYTEIKDSQTHFSYVASERLLYLKAKKPLVIVKTSAVTPAPVEKPPFEQPKLELPNSPSTEDTSNPAENSENTPKQP